MRISDWSTDVCSSDLERTAGVEDHRAADAALFEPRLGRFIDFGAGDEVRRQQHIVERARRIAAVGAGDEIAVEQRQRQTRLETANADAAALSAVEIGRASCRERVCQYV